MATKLCRPCRLVFHAHGSAARSRILWWHPTRTDKYGMLLEYAVANVPAAAQVRTLWSDRPWSDKPWSDKPWSDKPPTMRRQGHDSSAKTNKQDDLQWLDEIEDDDDEKLFDEIAKYAAMRPHPCSLQEILDMREQKELARFVQAEVPVRYAERIHDIRKIPDWRYDPDLVKLHRQHVEVFRDIRFLQKADSKKYPSRNSLSDPSILASFDDVVDSAHRTGATIPALATRAMRRMHTFRSDAFTTDVVDQWLDEFLLNWIGTETLLMQYLACAWGEEDGIIDPHCDVAELCRNVASRIQDMCTDIYGLRPHIKVESFSAVEADQRAPSFSYIPKFLQFVMQEVLKNSCRATLDTCPLEKLPKRPISVAVCADEHQVAIRISDRGRGIPFHVGNKIWSYMYTTPAKTKPIDERYVSGPTPLAGLGVGLPLSRLYCRYLGGWLRVVSWPGCGADVHLSLPRLSLQQIEVVPVLMDPSPYRKDQNTDLGQFIQAKRSDGPFQSSGDETT